MARMPQEARGPMQLHLLHRLKADPEAHVEGPLEKIPA